MESLNTAYIDLMRDNVYPPEARKANRIAIVSLCLAKRKPWVLKHLSQHLILAVCPEEHHINTIGFKVLGVLVRVKPVEVTVLTVDGSMHCIQLHYMVEELSRAFNVERRHLVLHEGEILEIDKRVIKASRFLSRVQKLYERCSVLGGEASKNV